MSYAKVLELPMELLLADASIASIAAEVMTVLQRQQTATEETLSEVVAPAELDLVL